MAILCQRSSFYVSTMLTFLQVLPLVKRTQLIDDEKGLLNHCSSKSDLQPIADRYLAEEEE